MRVDFINTHPEPFSGIAAGILLAFGLHLSAAAPASSEPFDTRFAEKPEYSVLVVVDGLAYKVWEKMYLPGI